MKWRLFLIIGIGLALVADVAAILYRLGIFPLGWIISDLAEAQNYAWFWLVAIASAILLLAWAANVNSTRALISLAIYFSQVIFYGCFFAGAQSLAQDPVIPLTAVCWLFFGIVQMIILAIRIRIEMKNPISRGFEIKQ